VNIYEYFLHSMHGIGDRDIEKLYTEFGDAKSAVDAIRNKNSKVSGILKEGVLFPAYERTIRLDPENEYKKLKDKKIRFITKFDSDFPERLKEITPVPYGIYVKGKVPEDDIPAVAIIGARNCSEYGTYVADSFGRALASEGVNIISGMARGIDGIGQRGALDVGGSTYAVLGSGVDVCYPMGNLKLYRTLEDNGGLLSIFPPGAEPLKRNFPMRNRIVAGLSDIILVVEAKEKSGTSITVDLALRMGKDVYTVPGRLTDRLSDGCNRLIRDGAGIALSPEDVIKELAIIWEGRYPDKQKLNYDYINGKYLFRKEKDEGVLKYLDTMPKALEEIQNLRSTKETGVPIEQTMSELIFECMEGRAKQVGTGFFYRVLK